MNKIVKRLKLLTGLLISFELIILVTFSIFYFLNLFGIKDYIQDYYVIAGAAVLILINIILVWSVVTRISNIRHKSDLTAAQVIGRDIQEAYNFGMIGLVVTDEKDTVLWTNVLFKDRNIDIIDMNVFSWQKDLLPLKDPNHPAESVKLIINSRHYEVKYLQEAGLYIFKDITDFESVYTYSVEQAPVVGILAIDNYDDVVRDDDDFNDLMSQAKNLIFTYCKDNGILLRRIKEDTYSILCNYVSFTKIKADRFSIIDKVRSLSKAQSLPLTISIGIAHDFPDVIKLNELANNALDIAMSRGGDQVVISAYGSEMEFIGGKSEATEKRNKVKTRVLADSLISLLKTGKNVIIMGHKDLDMDAFGACIGVKAICDRLDLPSVIVIDQKATERKTRGAILSSFTKAELEKMVVSSNRAESYVNPDTILIVVDVHTASMTMDPDLVPLVSKIVVIDHHRRGEDYIENVVFNHIDASSTSSCEIIAEFIKYCSINPRIELPAKYASIMLSGIFLDSTYFKNKATGAKTFEAATLLKEYGADNSVADDFLKDDFEEHIETEAFLSTVEYPASGIALITGKQDEEYDMSSIAKAANMCMSFKGVHAVFALAKITNKDCRMSARSDGTVNVQIIAEKLGGGGHYTSAAANFEKTSLENAKDLIINAIENHLDEAKNDVFKEEE